MPVPSTVHDIDEIDIQRREWAIQRALWVVLAIVVAAAAAGLVGTGPLSWTTAEASDGSVEVEYDRFLRYDAKSTMSVSISPDAVQGGKATLYLSRELVDQWKVEAVTPTPGTESSSEEWVIYEYDVLGETPPRIELHYRGGGLGRHEGVIRAGDDGTPVDIWQWIHP